jgi:hypothetical protein
VYRIFYIQSLYYSRFFCFHFPLLYFLYPLPSKWYFIFWKQIFGSNYNQRNEQNSSSFVYIVLCGFRPEDWMHECDLNISKSFLSNPSKHNINEICIITFNGALLHVSVPGNHHQAKYNKPITNYWIACYITSALEIDSYIHIQ